jgi:voltage-gated potassium channel
MKKFDSTFQPSSDSPYWQRFLYKVIFGTGTSLGWAFDMAVLISITVSTLFVMLESVQSISNKFGLFIHSMEWIFSVLFVVEYILRLLAVKNRTRYFFNFFAIIDLISILPGILIIFIPEAHSLMAVRVIRLLRVFRLFKMTRYIDEADILGEAIKKSMPKILVFLQSVLLISISVGALMYVLEGPAAGFTSIPRSVYWAVVTLTTVGYGDIAPQSPAGQFIALCLMILGYGIIAVPTGIVTSQLSQPRLRKQCPGCAGFLLIEGDNYCRNCGHPTKKVVSG